VTAPIGRKRELITTVAGLATVQPDSAAFDLLCSTAAKAAAFTAAELFKNLQTASTQQTTVTEKSAATAQQNRTEQQNLSTGQQTPGCSLFDRIRPVDETRWKGKRDVWFGPKVGGLVNI
jgi:hypothetical protein